MVRLAETAKDAAFSFSLWPERLCDHISPSAETLVGYTARAHYHDPRLPLTYVHPDDRPTLESPFESFKEYPDRLPIRWTHKNDSLVWTEATISIVRDKTGRPVTHMQLLRLIRGANYSEDVQLLHSMGRNLRRKAR